MRDALIGKIVRQAAILAAVWTVPVILGTSGHFLGDMMSDRGRSMPSSHIYGHSMAMWYVWIPATPLIFWLYRRIALRGAGWAIAPFAHLATLAGIFLLQTWVTLVVGHATGHISPDITFAQNLMGTVENLLLYDLLIYAGAIAVAAGSDYARRYQERDLRASQLETQLERARLETLQMQLQPHFLFNALNAIAMLVRRDRKQEAVDTIVGFGELLRYVLDESGTMDVPLETELRFVRRYLDIERVRLGERLTVRMDVPRDVERAIVPNLLLQPLVENALKHSIAVRPEGGRLSITAERRGATLRIVVAEDGPGVPAGWSVDASAGIGLRNLRERLAAFFGEQGRFSIANGAAGGVSAVVEIPYREAAGRPASLLARAV
jgi:two-component system LytT family sensor kinase